MKLNHAKAIVQEPKYLEALETIAEAETVEVEEDVEEAAEEAAEEVVEEAEDVPPPEDEDED